MRGRLPYGNPITRGFAWLEVAEEEGNSAEVRGSDGEPGAHRPGLGFGEKGSAPGGEVSAAPRSLQCPAPHPVVCAHG